MGMGDQERAVFEEAVLKLTYERKEILTMMIKLHSNFSYKKHRGDDLQYNSNGKQILFRFFTSALIVNDDGKVTARQ
jgi:hypothetical protein